MIRSYRYIYSIILLLLGIKIQIFSMGSFGSFPNIPSKIEFEVKLAPGQAEQAVKDVMNAMSGGLGTTTESITENVIKGLLTGIERSTEGEQLGNITRNVFGNVGREASRGLSEAMRDERLGRNLEEAGESWARMAGQGVGGARRGFRREIAPHITAGFRDLLSSFINTRNMIQYGSIVAGSIALPLAGYYGSRVAWNVLEKSLTNPKPEIVVKMANPVFGRWDRIRRWWRGYKTPPMIFDQSVKDRLTEIEEKTIIILKLIGQGRNMTYDNLLLYGKPGTGKTLFAQILADKTNMDFLPVTAASLLQAGIEGIKYFNELLEYANKSKYGVIIFVDEADALFIDRNTLDPASDHYKVLNHILAATGTGSKKFMLVAATNHAYVMDEAMGRRFQDRVLMPLPDATTRLALLDLYFAGTLLNSKENSADFVAKAKNLLTAGVVNDIVKRTNGLSHAEVKDMVATINKTAQISGITAKIINNVVNNAVEKHKISEEERMKREVRFGVKQEEVIVMPERQPVPVSMPIEAAPAAA
jgi:AAA+ superfamily predicted ATPase